MTQAEANKIGINIDDVHKLEYNVDDAFKTVCEKMIKKEKGNFTAEEIIIYILGKNEMKHRGSSLLDKTMDDKAMMSDMEMNLYEAHQKYKEYKKQYHEYKDSTEKALMVEAHKSMTMSLNNMLAMVENFYHEIWSCSECEDERVALKKTATNIYKKYCV